MGNPKRGSFFKEGYLALSDGTVFKGSIPSWQSEKYFGEVVFNTGMTGYVESLTDPSYSGQILVFTYPLIGNYDIQDTSVWESEKIHAAGVVISEVYGTAFTEWLREQKIPLITGIDTRALTKRLRSQGTMAGAISREAKSYKPKAVSVKFVSIPKPIVYNEQFKKKIILVDCGMKMNILRSLRQMPYRIKRVPRGYDYSGEDYVGIVLSNGPGDPANYVETVAVLKKALKKNRPVFGICLGSQIMALAAGAKTYKLKFGHRGHNQPVIEAQSGKREAKNNCYITSQNHGYAVDEKTLPKDWYVNFRNLNDNSVEGVAHKTKPFFSVQFHPEACPGPTDTKWLFDEFEKLL